MIGEKRKCYVIGLMRGINKGYQDTFGYRYVKVHIAMTEIDSVSYYPQWKMCTAVTRCRILVRRPKTLSSSKRTPWKLYLFDDEHTV